MTVPDGFVTIESHQLRDLGLNIDFTLDEFSPFTDREALGQRRDELIVDRYYGQAYHAMELRSAGIYGRTADLPAYSGDQLANHGFLRVPFRRIPRRVVHTRAEIEALLASIRSGDDNLRIQLRGQTCERTIKRSSETTRWLYGEDAVLEPSLTTSASRRKPALEEVLPEWAALLQVFITGNARGATARMSEEFATSYGFPLFALALAQHYGLPTSGLDVTDLLDVALFFALMKYDKPPDTYRATYARLTEYSDMPVLYVLAPAQQQQFDYESFRAEGFPPGRPDAQSARFMHVGWGYSENACARRIFLALYLDPSGKFDPVPSPAMLFPPGKADLFAGFLEQVSGLVPEKLSRVLGTGFYTVAAG